MAGALILGSGAIYFAVKWKPRVTKKIKEVVANNSRQLYKIDFKDIHINLLLGRVTLDSVKLTPDTAVFSMLRKYQLAPANLFEVELAHLKFTGIEILTAYFKREIALSAIVLERPSVRVLHYDVPKRKTVEDQPTLYQQLSQSIKALRIGQIKVADADVDYVNGADGKKLNTLKKLNVNVRDFVVDAFSQYDTTRFYYTKSVSFELLGYKSLSKDKMYTLKIDTLRGTTTGGVLEIKNFKMVPMFPDLEFSRKYKTQKDRYDLDFQDIVFRGVNFSKLDQDGKLIARCLKIGPAKVAVFMNRELPPPPIDKGRNYPHIALQRLPFPVIIDTLKLKGISVAYTEYNPITRQKGTVGLGNLHGNILNVTNDSLQLTRKGHIYADLDTRILQSVNLNIQIDFNLLAKDGAFSYKGHIGPMDMTALNPLARSLGLVKIEEGKVQKADFDIHANFHGSEGKMRFYYTGLKVALLKEGEDGEPIKKKGLLSFLANKFVIKDANPSSGEPVRTANISFQRTPAASFFNLLWKSVFTGIRETVGIGMVPAKSPEKAYEKVKDKKEERKEKQEKKNSKANNR